MTDATRIYRALLIDAKTDVSWDSRIRRTSRADDGRDPVESGRETMNNRREQAVDD